MTCIPLGRRLSLLGALAAAVGLGAAAAPRASADGYEVFDLGIGANGSALQVNESGTVSGNSFPAGPIEQPFVWRRGATPRLATLPLLDTDDTGGHSTVLAADGRILGWVTGPGGRTTAVLWEPPADGVSAYGALGLPALASGGESGLTSGATAFAASGTDLFGHSTYPGAGAALGERLVRWRRTIGPDDVVGPYEVEDLFGAFALGDGWLARVAAVDAAGRVYVLATPLDLLANNPKLLVWTEALGVRELTFPVPGAFPVLLPTSVNDAGVVAVNALVAVDTDLDGEPDATTLRAFYWRDEEGFGTSFVDLLAPAGASATGPATGLSFALGILADGAVVGFHTNGVDVEGAAALSGDPGALSELGALLVGFVWRPAVDPDDADDLVELPGLGASLGIVYPGFGVTDGGSLAGAAATPDGAALHAVRWDEDGSGGYTTTDLWAECGVFDPAANSAAVFINAVGRIAGFHAAPGADLFGQRAFVRTGPGELYDLTLSFAAGSSVTALTDSGFVLGQWSVASPVRGWGGSYLAAPLADDASPAAGAEEAERIEVDLCRSDTLTVTLDPLTSTSVTLAPSDILAIDPAALAAGVTIDIAPDVLGCAALGAGPQLVTVTVTDLCGRLHVCAALVEVVAPAASLCRADPLAVSLDANGQISITAADVLAIDPAALPPGVAIEIVPSTFDCSHAGASQSVTVTVTDPCGEQRVCTVEVQVADATPPTISCNPAVVEATTPPGEDTVLVVGFGVSAADNCAGSVSTSVHPSFPVGLMFPVGTHVFTWTATDAAGLVSECTQTIIVRDGDLAITCAGLEVEVSAESPATISADALIASLPAGAYHYGASASQTTFTCADAAAGGSVPVVVEVELYAFDSDAGDEVFLGVASCVATVTVRERAPSAVCRDAVLRVGQGPLDLVPGAIDGGSSTGCGGGLAVLGFDPTQLGAQAVTLRATSASGQTSDCVATVYVAAADELLYEVVDLGVASANVVAQTETGLVLGHGYFGRSSQEAFVWADGALSTAPLPENPLDQPFIARALVATGLVVGSASPFVGAQTTEQPAAWLSTVLPPTLIPLPGLGHGSGRGAAYAVNDAGVIAGWSLADDGQAHLAVWSRPDATSPYTVTRVGRLAGFSTGLQFFPQSLFLNAAGQIAGAENGIAYFWDPSFGVDGVVEVQVDPSAGPVQVRGLNALGQVLLNGTDLAFVAQADAGIGGGSAIPLPDFGGGTSQGGRIDDLGRVVGAASDENGLLRAALWVVEAGDRETADVALIDVGTLGGPAAIAFDVNAAGRVAAAGITAGGLGAAPFTWESGVQDRFWNVCGRSGLPSGIDASGRVAGGYGLAGPQGGSPDRVFVWAAPRLFDVMPAGGAEATVRAFNEVGQVAGTWDPIDASMAQRAFVARPLDAGALAGTLAVAIPNDPTPAAVECRDVTVTLDESGEAVLGVASLVASTSCGATVTAVRDGSGPGGETGGEALLFGCDDLGAPVTVTVTAVSADGLTSATCTALVTVVRSTYETIDLGPNQIPVAANEAGQVVVVDQQALRSFVWQAGVLTPIGPDAVPVMASALNDAGVVVGTWLAPEVGSRAFRWTASGGLESLPTAGAASAVAINASGWIAGTLSDGSGAQTIFIWKPGDAAVTPLGSLGGSSAGVLGLNDAGMVHGFAFTADGHQRVFFWRDGMAAIADIGAGAPSANATAVVPDPATGSEIRSTLNGLGWIIGVFEANDGPHGFVWRPGTEPDLSDATLTDLGLDHTPLALSADTVVGQVGQFGVGIEPFAWTPATGVVSLGAPLAPGDALPLSYASAVNAAGAIAGAIGSQSSTGFAVGAARWADLAADPSDLGIPAEVAVATHLADDGTVYGLAFSFATQTQRAFAWRDGVASDLGPTGVQTVALGGVTQAGLVFGRWDLYPLAGGFIARPLAAQPSALPCQDVTVSLDGSGEAVIDEISLLGALPEGIDLRDVTITPSTFGCADVGAGPITVTMTATDRCGNPYACTAEVTVVDAQAPALTCPANIAVAADAGACGAVVTYDEPVAVDNCTGAVVVRTAGLASGASFPVGVTTVAFEASDAGGNTASCSFTVTVTDAEDPTIVCPGPLTVPASESGAVALGDAIAADNCGVASVAHDAPATFPVGQTTTVTWTVTDTAGRTAQCTQAVTVTAASGGPEITCPPDITQPLERGVDPTDPAATGMAIASAGATVTWTDALVTTDTGCALALVRTFTATDAAGQVASCSQTIALQDTLKPALSFAGDPADAVVGACDPIPAAPAATAFDLADGDLTAAIAFSEQSFEVGANTVIVRTWTVRDACGNTATRAQTVTVDRASDCTLSQGYWKTHPGSWPSDAELVTIPGWSAAGLPSTGAAARNLLKTSPRGDATITLAHQLIAALLNTWRGACPSSEPPPAEDDGGDGCDADRKRWHYGDAGSNDDGEGDAPASSAAACIAEGVALLAAYPVGSNPRPSAVRNQLTETAGCLDLFNNGRLGTPKCGDGDDGCAGDRAPVASDVMATTPVGVPLTLDLLAAASDADGDPLSLLMVSEPGSGTIEVNGDGSAVYTPAPGFRGADSIAFAVADPCGLLASAAVCITVSGDPPPPEPEPDCETPVDAAIARSQVCFRSNGTGIGASFEGKIELLGGHRPSDLRAGLSAPGALTVRFGDDGATPLASHALDFEVRIDDYGRERWSWCGPDGARVLIAWNRTRRYTSWRDPSAPRSMGRLSTLFIGDDETRFRFDYRCATLPVTIAIDGIPLVTVTASGVSSAFPHAKGDGHVDVLFPAELVPGTQVDAYRDASADDGLTSHVYGHACGAEGNAAETWVGAGGCFWIEVPATALRVGQTPRRASVTLELGEVGTTACSAHADLAVDRYVKSGRLWFFQGCD